MAPLLISLLLWSSICISALCHTLAVHRDYADRDYVNSHSAVRSKLGVFSNLTSIQGQSLYWFGNFSVGQSTDLKLLIDTGSTDLILNRGVYEASKNEIPFKGKRIFHTGYEGVNRAGFGFETLSGTVQADTVFSGGLTIEHQTMGNVTKWRYQGVKRLPFANQGKGIIGFLGPSASAFRPKADSWFYNLCSHGLIGEHRFGLAFGTSGKGLIVVGRLAQNLIKGSLTSVPIIHRMNYNIKGDVTLNNEILFYNQTLDLDVGTDNIQGPIEATKIILDKLGYQTSLIKATKYLHVLEGFFDCTNPPTLGFSLPAQSQLKPGEKATIFNISPEVWDVYKNSPGNCTSILGGTNAYTDRRTNSTLWLVGQPFFAGHYVDFSIGHPGTMGFGNLVDPSMSPATA